MIRKSSFLNRGAAEIYLLLAIIVIGAFFLVGGFRGGFKDSPQSTAIVAPGTSTANLTCCDTGNGESCRVQTEKSSFTYKGTKYGLLKSNTVSGEGGSHLCYTGDTLDGNPIIRSVENQIYIGGEPSTCRETLTYANVCTYKTRRINEFMYVCKQNCPTDPKLCEQQTYAYYGSQKTVYDVYYQDLPTSEIPDIIKNCPDNIVKEVHNFNSEVPSQTIKISPYPKNDELQMGTFGIEEGFPQGVTSWLSPFCKPAIYLYPETESKVHVRVDPVGPFTYTTPLYTPGGWSVTARPNGTIISNNTEFPYLYYEADIPSLLIAKPQVGFSVKGQDVKSFLLELLPKLSLNTKETQEMADYWQKALPTSPYYFVGIIPDSTLDSIAPLSIQPKPDTVIRVALYFQKSETVELVKPPILTPVARTGFSVVEWGGILKTDKPFTCLQ